MTNEFEKLENALFRAGRELEIPPMPAIAARVRSELSRELNAAPVSRDLARNWLRILAPIAVAIVLALALLLAFPNTREAIGQFLGLRGLQIFYVTPTPAPTATVPVGAFGHELPTPTAQAGTPQRTPTPRRSLTPTVQPYTLCCPVSLEEAQRRAGFAILLPPNETPSKVYYQRVFQDGEQVVMVFGDPDEPRFTLYQAQRWVYGKLIAKELGPQTLLGEAQVDGERALWFSGAPHVVMMLDSNGQPVYSTARTVDANTLVWETGDADFGTIYRIETKLSLNEAVEIANSLAQEK